MYEPKELKENAEFEKQIMEVPHATMIFGLMIEGANWDYHDQVLIDSTALEPV